MAWKVSGSGKPTCRTAYQWAPPGGSDSGPRAVAPSRRRSGSSTSSSGNRSCSSAPRPWNRTSAPSGVPRRESAREVVGCSLPLAIICCIGNYSTTALLTRRGAGGVARDAARARGAHEGARCPARRESTGCRCRRTRCCCISPMRPRPHADVGAGRRRCCLSRSGLTRLVDRLEREGLLQRERCESDARGLFAVITAEGPRASSTRPAAHAPRRRARALPRSLLRAELRTLGGLWQKL